MNTSIAKELPLLMSIAQTVAARSKLIRKKVGAVIADKNGRIISYGYNGGIVGGNDTALEKKIYSNYDLIDGNDYPYSDGKGYYRLVSDHDRIIHAEQNALMYAARRGLPVENGILICTLSPCMKCASLVYQAGISTVVYQEEHMSIDIVRKTIPLEFIQSLG